MSAIDWDKLYRATSKASEPTPGYLINDIIRDVSNAHPHEIPAAAAYLADCVDGDHAHVKLKALFVIKSLAYRIPPFCSCMQERLRSVQDATVFTGPPSNLFGDEPYRLVREAASGALLALTEGQHYHEQYREMSQRIIGFGNFQPSEDTVLPDGSINVARDVSLKDLTQSTVGFVQNHVGSFLGGMKEFLTGPLASTDEDPEGLHAGIDAELGLGQPGSGLADEGSGLGLAKEEADVVESDEDDKIYGYHCPTGDYVPPALPLPVARASVGDSHRHLCPWEANSSTTRPGGAPGPSTTTSGVAKAWDASAAELNADKADEESRAALLRLLGISNAGTEGAAVGNSIEGCTASRGDECQPSEAEILDILGIGPGAVGSQCAARSHGAPSHDILGLDSGPTSSQGVPLASSTLVDSGLEWPAEQLAASAPASVSYGCAEAFHQAVAPTDDPQLLYRRASRATELHAGASAAHGLSGSVAAAPQMPQLCHGRPAVAVALNGGPGCKMPGMMEV